VRAGSGSRRQRDRDQARGPASGGVAGRRQTGACHGPRRGFPPAPPGPIRPCCLHRCDAPSRGPPAKIPI